MTSDKSFWKRLGGAFKRGNGAYRVQTDAAPDHVNADDRGEKPTLTVRAPTKRELASRYVEVARLMEAMHDHFRRQDERAAALVDSVQQVTGTISGLADVQRHQSESIKTIAERVVAVTQQSGKLSETLSMIPGSLDAQASAMQSLARQLEIAQEADQRVATMLGDLSQTVESLRSGAASQLDTLRKLQEKESDQRDTLSQLVREQNRRFIVVVIVAAVLGLAALAALVTALVLIMNRVG